MSIKIKLGLKVTGHMHFHYLDDARMSKEAKDVAVCICKHFIFSECDTRDLTPFLKLSEADILKSICELNTLGYLRYGYAKKDVSVYTEEGKYIKEDELHFFFTPILAVCRELVDYTHKFFPQVKLVNDLPITAEKIMPGEFVSYDGDDIHNEISENNNLF